MEQIDAREVIRKSFRIQIIIYSSIAVSVFVYYGLAHFISKNFQGPSEFSYLMWLRNALLVSSLFLFIFIPILKKNFIGMRLKAESSLAQKLQIGITANLLSWALAEVMVVFGLVMVCVSRDFNQIYLFLILCCGALFRYRPQYEELEKFALGE